ncbi:hypothetical protein [Rhizobium lentis]|uniref:Glycosyltransferase RgtA/B/C/D-like domain-containing protein n=1 Tax=Rhizobium lentis TaxID=1138194 RepID=A0ABS7IPU3_9HYPH|nr:hypothetical protein [Rhizobium lentis]MBX4976101.1 hypothetical protein [Rhizobium lentis]MBX5092462.1 hypothetical protein [Rhizobium lentis]
MSKSVQRAPQMSSLVLLTISVLCTHWMAFVNEGIFAEDAGLFPSLFFKDWDAIMNMYSSAAVPMFTYYVWPLSYIPNVFLLKAIVIFGIYIAVIFSYLIGVKCGFLTEREAFYIALFSNLLPITTVTVIITYSTYFNAYALFLVATYLFISVERTRGSYYYLVRVASIFIYFVSFTLNSLLVLYAAAFILAFLIHVNQAARQVGNLRELIFTFLSFCRSKIDFTVLPIVYWLHKGLFYEKTGLYSNYNSFDLDIPSLANNSYRFLVNGIVGPIGIWPVVIGFGDLNFYVISAVFVYSTIFVTLFFLLRTRNAENPDINNRKPDGGLKIISFGLFLLLCGTLPYILVGKSPELGVLMRNAILMPLPLAVIAVGVLQFLQRKAPSLQGKRTSFVLLLIVLTLFTNRWWESYAAWQARAAKDLAVSQYLIDNPQWSTFSNYWITDKFPMPGEASEYGFADYTSKFHIIWGGQTRMAFTPQHMEFFGIDSAPGVRPVHSTYPARIAFFCDAWASAKDIDLSGPQAELEISSKKSSWDNASLAYEYLYFRFIRPSELKTHLSGLVSVTLRAL